jgi:hypothetical protein
MRRHGAERGARRHAGNRTRDGGATDRQQLLHVELQSDAEHDQDDADFGELFGQLGVGREAGGVRPDQHAGNQVANDRRQAETLGHVPQHQGGAQTCGQHENDFSTVHRGFDRTRPERELNRGEESSWQSR